MASLMPIEVTKACLSGRRKHSDKAMRGGFQMQVTRLMKRAQLSV